MSLSVGRVKFKPTFPQAQVFEDMVKLEYFKYNKNLLIVPL